MGASQSNAVHGSPGSLVPAGHRIAAYERPPSIASSLTACSLPQRPLSAASARNTALDAVSRPVSLSSTVVGSTVTLQHHAPDGPITALPGSDLSLAGHVLSNRTLYPHSRFMEYPLPREYFGYREGIRRAMRIWLDRPNLINDPTHVQMKIEHFLRFGVQGGSSIPGQGHGQNISVTLITQGGGGLASLRGAPIPGSFRTVARAIMPNRAVRARWEAGTDRAGPIHAVDVKYIALWAAHIAELCRCARVEWIDAEHHQAARRVPALDVLHQGLGSAGWARTDEGFALDLPGPARAPA